MEHGLKIAAVTIVREDPQIIPVCSDEPQHRQACGFSTPLAASNLPLIPEIQMLAMSHSAHDKALPRLEYIHMF